MQQYAEEAVNEHIPQLQQTFFQEKKGRSYAPFSKHVTKEEINASLTRSMRDSDRYRRLKKSGASTEEINRIFDTKTEMQVFSYNGMIDTIMSPRDSVRYIKHFLRCGFVSIDSKTGHVKAYVGGPDFAHFQYDMVTLGKRQVGSTIKPFLYTLAMDEGMWPCDKTMNVPITLKDGNGEDWSPTNASSARIGEGNLEMGLANSTTGYQLI